MTELSPHLSLAVGDRVVYPNQGVCLVFAIEAKDIAGQKLTFVTMKREEDGAVVMVPEAKVQTIGLRKVATSAEVTAIYSFLNSDSDKADLDWKQRARTNVERMSQGGILGLAEVVKGLQVLSELRPLPTKERELYDSARHLLVTEIAVSLGVPECDAEDSIDIILFPIGRERPKRTAAEFAIPGSGEDDGLDLGGDLLGLDGDLELPPDELEAQAEPEAEEASEDEEEAPEKPAKGAKAVKAPKAAKKPVLSDDDETQPMGSSLLDDEALTLKPKRGRPAKVEATPPPEPKKRGRPPKVKPIVELEVQAPAARRGRPPKAAAAAPKAAAGKEKPKAKKK